MEVMYDRKTGKRYEVFGFDVDHLTALCFDGDQASRSGGNGWKKIPAKTLIPEEYANKTNGSYMSKTERNEIKHSLRLVDAVWECTDGRKFTHKAIDDAIEHQRQLMACTQQKGEINCEPYEMGRSEA